MNEKPTVQDKRPITLQTLREWTAAILSVMIMIGTITLVIIALQYVGANGEEFTRVKDLLLFLNPLLGVVIGYYFNKVSSDARAETAETAVFSATATAQQAVEARDQAVALAQAASHEAMEAKASLQEVSDLASQVVAQPESMAAPGTLGAGEDNARPFDVESYRTQLELQAALARAQRILDK